MKKVLVMTMIAATSLTACSSEKDVEAKSNVVNLLEGEPSPLSLTAEQASFVGQCNDFSFDFFRTAIPYGGIERGCVYSPMSIAYVLGMANDGATGETSKEILQTLGFSETGTRQMNEFCATLIEQLPKADPIATLRIANSLYVNQQFTLKSTFMDDMKKHYHADAASLDFREEASLNRINDWCHKQTEGMIPKILDNLNPQTVLYLLNAIYFKADWTNKFDSKNTRKEAFTAEDGSSSRTDIMHQEVRTRYLQNETFSAISLPYGHGLWQMSVLLPGEGKTIADVLALLSADYWGQLPWDEYDVDVKLPRFETETDTKDFLPEMLEEMGIREAFDSQHASFPGICEDQNLYITMMKQKAKIEVNEDGTKAAAVTIAGMALTSVGPQTYPSAVFHANRPFLYVIQERSSNAIFFIGSYTGQ